MGQERNIVHVSRRVLSDAEEKNCFRLFFFLRFHAMKPVNRIGGTYLGMFFK